MTRSEMVWSTSSVSALPTSDGPAAARDPCGSCPASRPFHLWRAGGPAEAPRKSRDHRVALTALPRSHLASPGGYGREGRFQNIFEAADHIVGQDAYDEETGPLQFQVLSPVATIRLGVAEVVIAVDLDGQAQGIGQQADFHRAVPNRMSTVPLSRNTPAVSESDSSRSYRNRSAGLRGRPPPGRGSDQLRLPRPRRPPKAGQLRRNAVSDQPSHRPAEPIRTTGRFINLLENRGGIESRTSITASPNRMSARKRVDPPHQVVIARRQRQKERQARFVLRQLVHQPGQGPRPDRCDGFRARGGKQQNRITADRDKPPQSPEHHGLAWPLPGVEPPEEFPQVEPDRTAGRLEDQSAGSPGVCRRRLRQDHIKVSVALVDRHAAESGRSTATVARPGGDHPTVSTTCRDLPHNWLTQGPIARSI